jgi:P27 family predicted phage terminase small subunit
MAGNSNSGRRPKPTAIKILEGNRGGRPLNDREPRPAIVLPKPPDHLDTLARKEWNRVAHELYSLGILSSLDVGVLAAMCVAHSDEIDAVRALRRQGKVLKDRHGRLYQNPMMKIANDARRDKIRFAIELGMTPSARSKIRIDEIPKLDTPEDASNRDEFLDD